MRASISQSQSGWFVVITDNGGERRAIDEMTNEHDAAVIASFLNRMSYMQKSVAFNEGFRLVQR